MFVQFLWCNEDFHKGLFFCNNAKHSTAKIVLHWSTAPQERYHLKFQGFLWHCYFRSFTVMLNFSLERIFVHCYTVDLLDKVWKSSKEFLLLPSFERGYSHQPATCYFISKYSKTSFCQRWVIIFCRWDEYLDEKCICKVTTETR